jgi:hypothetical protein
MLRPGTPIQNNVRVVSQDYKAIPRPDKFKGDGKGTKAKEFAHKIKKYLRCLPNMDPELYMDVVSGFLEGSAYTWFLRWEKSYGDKNLDSLLESLISHFSPSNVSQDARRKLSTLKQKTSVQDYAVKFREILEEINEIEEMESKTYFLNGLKDQVRKEVRLKDLNDDFTLDVMEQVACQIDSILYSSNDFRSFGTPRQSGPTPMQGVHFGNLTIEEVAKYRQEGRCFKCHRTGNHTSGCKSRFVFRSHNMETGENEDSGQDGSQKEGESA